MIILFTDSTDVHSDAVERELHARATTTLRIDSDLPQRWRFDYLDGEVCITKDGQQFGLGDLTGAFFRRTPDHQTFEQLPHSAPSGFDKHIAEQHFVQTSDCIALISDAVRSVNPIGASLRAQNKLHQQVAARRVGLALPKTFQGSSPSLARKLTDEALANDWNLCSKPISNKFVEMQNDTLTRFTELVSRDDLLHLDTLNECPITMQQYIEKAYELRISVVGHRVFACKIDSQAAGGETAIDWRKYNIPKTPHCAVVIPSEIANMLLSLHEELGLVYSSFDLIVNKQQDYIFLETNPSGQWLWIEDLVGLPITAAIADELSR